MRPREPPSRPIPGPTSSNDGTTRSPGVELRRRLRLPPAPAGPLGRRAGRAAQGLLPPLHPGPRNHLLGPGTISLRDGSTSFRGLRNRRGRGGKEVTARVAHGPGRAGHGGGAGSKERERRMYELTYTGILVHDGFIHAPKNEAGRLGIGSRLHGRRGLLSRLGEAASSPP